MMNRDILVTILEDDFFSRNWMTLLLVRDWRTRVVGEVASQAEFPDYLKENKNRIDVLVVDTDVFQGDFILDEIWQHLKGNNQNPKVLLTGVRPNEKVIKQIDCEKACGYILKHEIGISFNWAITFCYEGNFILTPSTHDVFSRATIPSMKQRPLVLDGRKTIPGFTDREKEVAKLAFVFSLGRKDLADELKISEQWSYGLVSELYEKMGLGEILSGEIDPKEFWGNNQIIQSHFVEIVKALGSSQKAKDLEILAYHLMTMPNIID